MHKPADLAEIRRVFDGGQGGRPAHNAALQLADEIEALRADAVLAANTNAALAKEVVALRAQIAEARWEDLGFDGKPRAGSRLAELTRGGAETQSAEGGA